MPTVAIHCKASISDGMGHIYRQINLANELKKKGWEIFFYIPHFTPAVDLITRSSFNLALVDPKALTSQYFDKSFCVFSVQSNTRFV